jgi:hypothetical protein
MAARCGLATGATVFLLCAAAAHAQSVTTGKWEIEVHAGAARPTSATGGTAATLPVGTTFVTLSPLAPSRRESSWWFGDGAALLNSVNRTLAPSALLTPLDAVILGAAGSRRSGASAGVRVTRRFGRRYSAGFDLDYARTPLRFTKAALDGIESSRGSFMTAFRGLFISGPSPNPNVSATATITEGTGSELITTGVFGVDLTTRGRFVPFVLAGGGIAHNAGTAPTAALVGNYGFPIPGAGVSINETDRVTIRLDSRVNSPVGVFGGGFRYAASPRWGIRGDVRVVAGSAKTDVLVDASPSTTNTTPGILLVSPTFPNSAVFSSSPALTSSLTGPAISGLRTFEGSGVSFRTNVTGGVYLRF